MATPLIEIKNLHARLVDDPSVVILKGLDLTINDGEVHSIMGPNGSGKSTLASILAGKEDYEITDGTVLYQGKDLLELEADERAQQGVFLAFQYPVEVPGVSNTQFLKAALNARRKARGEGDIDVMAFVKLAREKAKLVDIPDTMLKRSVNEGFSGGEKKRFEIFQLALLEPHFAILDETDSGLDIDALRVVADGVNNLRAKDRAFLIITHYQRLLNFIVPDYVHVMVDGRIVKSGGKELALELEEKGYGDLEPAAGAGASR